MNRRLDEPIPMGIMKCHARACECDGCYYNEVESLRDCCQTKYRVRELLENNIAIPVNKLHPDPHLNKYRYFVGITDTL